MQIYTVITKKCTPVVFTREVNDNIDLTLRARKCNNTLVVTQKPFRPKLPMSKEEILDLLDDLTAREGRLESEARVARQTRRMCEEKVNKTGVCYQKVSREEAVNIKRENIRRVIFESNLTTIKDIAEASCCHASTVKEFFDRLQLTRHVPLYTYPNTHPQHTNHTIQSVIEDPSNKFYSTSDIKRIVPQCSRKYIRRQVKRLGYRYLKTERQRRDPKLREYKESELNDTIAMSAQAMLQNDDTIFFLDEVEFPLNITSDYSWCKTDQRPLYNRRDDESSLYVIALCGLDGFRAVQVFENDINKEAILYFMSVFLQSIGKDKKIVILLDNAGWHHAKLLRESGVQCVFWYNVPRMYELNLIEIAFSAIKSEFRRRRAMMSRDEEVEMIIKLFMNEENEKRFYGYRRHYLRNLKHLLIYGAN